jgi:hypothetical protein
MIDAPPAEVVARRLGVEDLRCFDRKLALLDSYQGLRPISV